MKTIILHGEDYPKTYERLTKFIDEAKKRNWEVIRVSDKSQNIAEILSSTGLFQSEKLVVIEDPKLLATFSKWLNKNAEKVTATLVVVSKNILGKTIINSLPEPKKIEEYKLPKLIWNFLDSLYPGNSKSVITTFHKIIQREPVELVFALIAKQLIDVYALKAGAESAVAPWKAGKLKFQASKFTAEGLAKFINLLAEIDIKVKTSDTNLKDELDFLFVSKL